MGEEAGRPGALAPVLGPGGEGTHDPRRVGIGRGLGWLVDGGRLFAAAPLVWILITLAYGLLTVAGYFVPVVGPLVLGLLYPVFMGGIMLGAHDAYRGGTPRFDHLFAGFGRRAGALTALGAVYLGGSIAITGIVALIMMLTLGGNALAVLHMAQEGNADPALIGVMITSGLIAGLIALGCLVPLYMALWFAPALIVLHDEIGVGDALGLSFRGCWRNFLPFLLYGVVLLVAMLVASLPLGLGLLVLGPLVFASIYLSYREIFVD